MSDLAVSIMRKIVQRADRARAAEAKRCAAFLVGFLEELGLESAAADLRTLEMAIVGEPIEQAPVGPCGHPESGYVRDDGGVFTCSTCGAKATVHFMRLVEP